MRELSLVPENPYATGETQKFRTQMGHISRHSSTFFLGTVFRVGAGYLFKVYLARTLGPEPLGIYTLGMTIIGFMGMFGGLGLPQAAVRFVAQYTASGKTQELRHFLFSATSLLVATNLAMAALALWAGPWLAVRFYRAPSISAYLPLFAVIMVLGAITTFFGKILQGYRQVALLTVFTDFIGTPVTILCSVFLFTR